MHAVGAARGDEIRPVVEDEQRPVGVGRRAEGRGRGDQAVVAEPLVAQLDHVHAPAQRRLEERLRTRVADEIEAGAGDALSRGHHCLVKHLSGATMTPYGSPLTGLRGRHGAADRRT